MFLTGTGVGIIYAGMLCRVRPKVEYNNRAKDEAAPDDQVYRAAIGCIVPV